MGPFSKGWTSPLGAVLPLKPQLPSKLPDIQPKTDLDYDGLVVPCFSKYLFNRVRISVENPKKDVEAGLVDAEAEVANMGSR